MSLPTQDREPSPAELFEDFFGPPIFSPWTRVLLEYARPRPGERVLDLACATGIVARRVAPLVAPGGSVTGVDISPAMLEVARDRAAREGLSVEWREGDATRLDLPDDAFPPRRPCATVDAGPPTRRRGHRARRGVRLIQPVVGRVVVGRLGGRGVASRDSRRARPISDRAPPRPRPDRSRDPSGRIDSLPG